MTELGTDEFGVGNDELGPDELGTDDGELGTDALGADDGELFEDSYESESESEYEYLPEVAGAEAVEGTQAMSRMLFVDVILVLPATHPVVVLQEADAPYRELRIPIGGPEGVAISYAARQMATPRPLTHELMTSLLDTFNLTLDMVRITGVSGRTFYAELAVSGPQGPRSIDCRPSDAIALALRQQLPVPIMVMPDVLETAGGGAAGQN